MSSQRFTLLVLVLLGGVVAPSAGATVYDLYYLGGQSNMDGYGLVEELPPQTMILPIRLSADVAAKKSSERAISPRTWSVIPRMAWSTSRKSRARKKFRID